MPTWRHSLVDFYDRAWQELEDFKTPRTGTPGLISLASVSTNLAPEIRTVVMRRVDRVAGTIETFTDSATPKIVEFRNNPNVSALIWQPENGLQIRVKGTIDIITDDAVAPEWEHIPERGRKNYGVTPAPGTPIETPDAYERIVSVKRLANLKVTVEELDVVHIGRPYDIRASFRRSDNWAGQWLSP